MNFDMDTATVDVARAKAHVVKFGCTGDMRPVSGVPSGAYAMVFQQDAAVVRVPNLISLMTLPKDAPNDLKKYYDEHYTECKKLGEIAVERGHNCAPLADWHIKKRPPAFIDQFYVNLDLFEFYPYIEGENFQEYKHYLESSRWLDFDVDTYDKFFTDFIGLRDVGYRIDAANFTNFIISGDKKKEFNFVDLGRATKKPVRADEYVRAVNLLTPNIKPEKVELRKTVFGTIENALLRHKNGTGEALKTVKNWLANPVQL